MSLTSKLLSKYIRRQSPRRRRATFAPRFESLESRRLLAVSAIFTPGTGILNVYGDSAHNAIEISRNLSGNLLVNNGAVNIIGGSPTVANTTLINAFGLAGDDTITLNQSNGALPQAHIYGGSGTDTIIGGSAADMLFGQSGNDIISGNGENDFLFGGSGGDQLTGGDGDDLKFGQSDNDHLIWNPGDDTDLNEGGIGIDTIEVNGGGGAEQFTTIANGTRVRFDRLDPAPFSIDIGTSEHLFVNMNGGDDKFSATGNLAALITITVDGGTGNDTLLGSNGSDTLIGGEGDDFLDGQQGNDGIFMGADNDIFQWDPGDGNDIVEGQGGHDIARINGSGAGEIFDISPNGQRVRFARNVGSVVHDIDGVEQIDVHAAGGADTAIVSSLAGTATTAINFLLNAPAGGGDAQVDNIFVNGTAGEDVIFVTGNSGSVSVIGLAAMVNIFSAEPANDRLTVNMASGDDILDASGLLASAIALTADGGDDDDVLTGSDGADILLGGLGDDVLIGGPGLDILDGGPGDNVVIQ